VTARALSRAAQVAFPFTEAVRTRNPRMVELVTSGLDRQELEALAIILAEAAGCDPMRLKAAKDAALAESDALP
jgi:hypothetical protein